MEEIMRLIIIILFCLNLLSCGQKNNLQEIKIEDVFNQKDERYYVLFYMETCPICIDTLKYLKLIKINDPFYLVEMSSYKDNKTSTFYTNIGVNSSFDIKINQTPTLLQIENKIVVNEIIGFEKIREVSWA
jgi:glutaredoxin-related protein